MTFVFILSNLVCKTYDTRVQLCLAPTGALKQPQSRFKTFQESCAWRTDEAVNYRWHFRPTFSQINSSLQWDSNTHRSKCCSGLSLYKWVLRRWPQQAGSWTLHLSPSISSWIASWPRDLNTRNENKEENSESNVGLFSFCLTNSQAGRQVGRQAGTHML